MSLRIGSIILTPNSFMLPMALAFFLVLGTQELRRVFRSPGHARGALALSALCGILAGWAYAAVAANGDNDGLPTAFDLRFGSFGGYWGVLLGGALYARLTRHSVPAAADALVIALLGGAAVARVGCLFTGCCTGITIPGTGFQPFRPWPAYDIAALLFTLWFVTRIRQQDVPGQITALFLLVYGVLRFALEFARNLQPVESVFTINQFPAATQAVIGLLWLLWLRKHLHPGPEVDAPPTR